MKLEKAFEHLRTLDIELYSLNYHRTMFDFHFYNYWGIYVGDIFSSPATRDTEAIDLIKHLCPNGMPQSLIFDGILEALMGIIAHTKGITPLETLAAQEALMGYKQEQYGDAVLNPTLYCLSKDEIPIVVKGLINNKINRLIHQSDDEDSLVDLFGYLIFWWCLQQH